MARSASLRILVLEDVPMDAELLEYELSRAGIDCVTHCVENRDAFLQGLREFRPDLILSDYSLPGFDGMAALRLAREVAPAVPFIVVTGSINEETAVGCMRAGAADYLLKNNLARIGPAIEAALAREQARVEKWRAEEALRRSEANLRAIFHNTRQDFVLLDRRGVVLTMNKRASDWAEWVVGREVHEGDALPEILPDAIRAEWQLLFDQALANHPQTIERLITRETGAERWFEASLLPVVESDGTVIGVCLGVVNIDDRKRTEDHLRRVEKMQAVGRLAGGVAHEVNNMMTVILGFGDFLMRGLPAGDQRSGDIREIVRAAERAASVTQQLLAFSRQQILQPRVIDLNQVVAGLDAMLARVIGTDHQLHFRLEPTLASVRADVGQIEQVLVNLVLNARDSMPRGGRITLETAPVMLDDAYLKRHAGVRVPHGSYVMLAVSDTGHGMDAATQARIFEPFFTTKPTGKGTGLGLSTVYGIVKQSDGYIWVYSEPGIGTTFKIYLPAIAADVAAAAAAHVVPPVDPVPRSGSERILVVEDEEIVRELTCRLLRDLGYTVLEAQHGLAGLGVIEKQDAAVDLVISDVVMPEMGGRELGMQLNRRFPDLPVLYMSGYTGEDVVQRGLLEADAPFQQKPFHPDALARKVRDMLDHRRTPSARPATAHAVPAGE